MEGYIMLKRKNIINIIILNVFFVSQFIFGVNNIYASDINSRVGSMRSSNPTVVGSVYDSKEQVSLHNAEVIQSTIDVKRDYGANGDGITDDTSKIQNALNNGSGKNVFFPAGSYKTTGGLSFPNNITIIGEGTGKTKIITTSGNAFYVLKARKGIKISDISFVGNSKGRYCQIDLVYMTDLLIQNCSFEKSFNAGIQVQKSSNVTIDNCEVTGSVGWGNGLAFVGVDLLTVQNCNIHDNTGGGINITGTCSNFKVINNKSTNNGGYGLSVTGNSHDFQITGNTCTNNGNISNKITAGEQDGINGHKLNNGTISNNICKNNVNSGISIDGKDGMSNTSCRNVTITNNNCESNKKQGIYLYYTQYCTVDSNTCLKNEGLGGIALTGAKYNTITNNNSHDNGVINGKRVSDILLETGADNNTIDKNSIGSIERNDETVGITIRSKNNYIGAIDYSNYKWSVSGWKTPILISDLVNQQYSTDIVKTVESKEFTLSNSSGEDVYIFTNTENARLLDAKIIYTQATSSDKGVNIKLGKASDDDYFGTQTTGSSMSVNTSTSITLIGDKQLTAGTQLRVHSDNKKKGLGKVKVRVRVMIPMYYI